MTRFVTSCLSLLLTASCGGEQIPDRERTRTVASDASARTADRSDVDGTDAAPGPIEEPAERLGSFNLTYYWIATQNQRREQVSLFTRSCQRIARVSRSFARRATLEGSGRLLDGRMVTVAGRCKCGQSPCFRVTRRRPDSEWGIGVDDRPLSPFRSVAVDSRHIAIGDTLYIPELDGMTMPGDPAYGGFVHDGCVVADDQGKGVKGRKIDFFTATRGHYRSLFERHGIDRVTVFAGGDRCRFLVDKDAPQPKRGSVSAI